MASSPTDRRAVVPNGHRDSRVARALTERMAVVPVGDGVYDVVTDGDTVYTVNVEDRSCTCPDHRIRGTTCKHLYRVTHDIEAGAVPGPEERNATCVNCGTDFHAPAAQVDPVYCPACTLSPGEPVRDRERGDVLIVVRSTNRRANQVTVPGTDHTVAAHPGNERFDPADLVVEAMYPLPAGLTSDAVQSRRVRRYSFPRRRLERVV